jgi:peptide deformylase
MIKLFPSPILREVAKKVENFGSLELETLIACMFNTMADKNGVGLAAPQISVSQRIFVYGFENNPRYPEQAPVPRDYVINPEIIWESQEKVILEEGCLSFPGLRLLVSRPKAVIFKTFDMRGKCMQKEASGFFARIMQHENDHLRPPSYINNKILNY